MKGRKAKPAVLKDLEGNPGHRPISRGGPQPAAPTRTPRVPSFLNEHAKKEWRRMVKLLVRLRLYTDVDRAALAMYCQVYGRWVAAELELEKKIGRAGSVEAALVAVSEKGNPYQDPLLSVANAAWEQIRKMLAEFGLTPAARQRLANVEPLPDQDDFLEKLFGIRAQIQESVGD